MHKKGEHLKGFYPFAAAAFLVGIVGGFTTVLGPAFMLDMDLAYNNTTWTALATAVSSAACAPVLGRLGDVIGRRKTLLIGIGVYTLGNIMTAAAPGLVFMLVARFVVGVGTAAVTPAILSYIVSEFPPESMAGGFSIYMLISSAAVIFGPALGSAVINRWGWRVMMLICTALCAAIFFVCFFTVKPSKGRGDFADFDGPGAAMVLIFFSLALCVPSFGQNFGWASVAFAAVTVAALASLAALVFVEKRAKNPILKPEFLARRNFVLPVAILFLTQGLMQANMTNAIVFVNYTQAENNLISGYAISIMYLGMSIGALVAGVLGDRQEPRSVLTGSLALTGIGCGLMLLFDTNTSGFLLAASLGLLGLGLGGNGTTFLKVVLSDLKGGDAGAGTGTYGLFRDLAAPFGVAVFVPMFTNRITRLTEPALAAGETLAAAGAEAAVNSVRTLAVVETACVAAAIVIVRFLPRIRQKKAGPQKT